MYNILEAKIEFRKNVPVLITVLVEISKREIYPGKIFHDIRAICASNRPHPGYMHIPPDASVNDELLQEIAGYGCETVDIDEIFPNWKAKYYKK